MSRIYLAGYGEPIPILSLPDSNATGERPTIEFILEDGVLFEKAPYVDLGYTHFQVWAVGAAGGEGGDAFTKFKFETNWVNEVLSDYWWNRLQAEGRIPLYHTRTTPVQVAVHHDPYLLSNLAWGGAGGGGGVHVVNGSLDELPDFCPVVVGEAGSDAYAGQAVSRFPYDPQPPLITNGSYVGFGSYDYLVWANRYPEPHTLFLPPEAGEDGGASSFNGAMCIASGGKGGRPAVVWDPESPVQDALGNVIPPLADGKGGEGGIGGRAEAGGGGAGGHRSTLTNLLVHGNDGTWDGTIAKGGGGGVGGVYSHTYAYGSGEPGSGHGETSGYYSKGPGSNGGRGAFSYLDTTIYGAKGLRVPWRVDENGRPDLDEDPTSLTHSAPGAPTTSVYSGSEDPVYLPVIPGAGGGVRANRKHPYGSRAAGYNPNGLVLLRLIKLD